jgi:DNA/RNA-binding domain of Phe-tRNA-synthetase-like protein
MNQPGIDGTPQAFSPQIAPAIWRIRPDFTALSIVAESCVNAVGSPWVAERLVEASRQSLEGPAWAEAHLSAWQDVFRAFGAKPQRTPCSAEALRRRIARGGMLLPVNAVVDLCNAVSIAFAVPVGGEDIACYAGNPELTVARGDETFETVKDGLPAIENPERGEVIWRDERGVTCRRWNWRQGPRTQIYTDTRAMWFVLERLEPMPLDALMHAGDILCADLERLSPGVRFTRCLFQKDGQGSTRE